MTESITLSSTLTSELRENSRHLNISLNELAEKLLRQSLDIFERQKQTKSIQSEDDDDWMTMEDVIARIKSRPKNTGAFHPATKSVDEVLAIREAEEADPSYEHGLTTEEWDIYWLPWHQEMKRREKTGYLFADWVQLE